jgi:hypothetical protein
MTHRKKVRGRSRNSSIHSHVSEYRAKEIQILNIFNRLNYNEYLKILKKYMD